MKRKRGTKVIAQKHNWDCGVASLAMFLDVPYGDVAAQVRAMYDSKPPNKRGLMLYHMEELAAAFGVKLKRIYRSKDYLKDRTGILGVLGGNMSWCGHWVVLKANAIIDPDDGTVWDALDYLQANKTRPCTLLVKDGQ